MSNLLIKTKKRMTGQWKKIEKKEKKKKNLNTVEHSIKKTPNIFRKDRQCIDCIKRKTEHLFELCEL